jgi:hypothetical protein
MTNGGEASAEKIDPANCRHARLLERVRDRDGQTTNTLQCCECGALVARPLDKPTPSQSSTK